MRLIYVCTLLLIAICFTGHSAELEKYRDTSWYFANVATDNIQLISRGKPSGAGTLYIEHEEGRWRVVVATSYFLVDNPTDSLGVRVTFNAKKPFTITNRRTVEYCEFRRGDDLLVFLGDEERAVNWIISKELIEVSIQEMGGTNKTLTFDTHGLKEVMLEAQRRQRAL